MSIRSNLESIIEKFAGLLMRLNPLIEYQVLGSGLSKSIYKYASTTLLLLVIATLSTSSLIAIFFKEYGAYVSTIAGLLAGITTFTSGLALVIAVPGTFYKNRGSTLEPRFPLFASALLSRLLSGSTLAYAILDMAERDLRDLPWFKIEMEYLSSMTKAGIDVHEALERAAHITPSPSLKRLFSSLAVASRTGSGVTEIVDTLLRDFLFAVETEIDRVTSSLAALLEFYVSLSVMLPVVVGVVGLLLLFPLGRPLPSWLNFNSMLFLATFILTPIVSALVIILSDSIISKVRV
jgi:flagellar protein FlaJ